MLEQQHLFTTEGTHVYRIPSLMTAADGTLLASCNVRKGGKGDFGHDTDVVLRRSHDGGRTWEPTQVLASRPGADIHGGPRGYRFVSRAELGLASP